MQTRKCDMLKLDRRHSEVFRVDFTVPPVVRFR